MVFLTNGETPVNPTKYDFADGSTLHTFGLTKREYFAAIAMQGLSNLVRLHIDPVKGCHFENTEMIADMSVALADALLAALDKDCVKEGMK